MSALTIGFVANTFAPIPGGMEAYLDHLSSALALQNHDVRIVTRFVDERPTPLSALLRSTEPARTFTRGDVTVHLVSPPSLRHALLLPTSRLRHYTQTQPLSIELYAAGFYPALHDALRGCDVIHYSGTGHEMLGFVAARVADALSVPFVVTPHTHAGVWGDGPFDVQLYRQAQAVIALTDYERRILVERGVAPDRVHVQGHGVNVSGTGDGSALRTKMGIGDAPLLLFLGRKSDYKGYPLLLSALPLVWPHHPDAQLILAGPTDPSLALAPETARVLQDDRVHSLGFVSDQAREDLYAACDVFCLPSTAEAFGLAYMEAGVYGKPVVGLDIPTLSELIHERQCGLLTAPTPESVAEALDRLLTAPSLRKALGEQGQKRARQQTWDQVARRMTAIYGHAGQAVRKNSAAPPPISSFRTRVGD